MADNINRSINISLNVIGNIGTKIAEAVGEIDKLTKKLQPLTSGLNNLSDGLKNVATPLNSLKNLGTLPDFKSLSNGLNDFAKVNLEKPIQKINQLSAALLKMSDGTTIIRNIADALSQINRYSDSIDKLARRAKKSESALQSFGDKIKRYSQYRIIADAVIGLQNALNQGVASIVEYDQALYNLQAITRATGDQVAQMGGKILEVASETKFSASEIADGMVVLGQAGLSANESITTIDAVANLATGTLSDMKTTVDLVTTAMRVFNISSEETGRIADVFANAVNRSKLTIDKLRTAMNFVGPIAKDAGLSLEETAAALGTLANSGLRASTIGTSIRRFLSELLEPTDKLAAAANEAGVSLSSLDTNTNSLSDVLKALRVVLEDTETGALDAGKAVELFGKRGSSGVLAALQEAENGQLIFDQMTESVSMTGTAAEMAEIQLKGLQTGFKNLSDKVGVLMIALGNAGVTGALRGFLNLAKEVVVVITNLVENGFIPAIAKMAIMAAGVLSLQFAFAGLKTVILAADTLMLTLIGTTSAGAAAMGIFAAAINGVKIAIAALAFGPFTGGFVAAALAIGVVTGLLWQFGDANKNARRELDQTITALGATKSSAEEASRAVTGFRDRIDNLSGLEINQDNEYFEQHRILVSDLIKKYPEWAIEIFKAKGNLVALDEVLTRIQENKIATGLEAGREQAILFGEKIDGARQQILHLESELNSLEVGSDGKILDSSYADGLNKELTDLENSVQNWKLGIADALEKDVVSGASLDWATRLGTNNLQEALTLIYEGFDRAGQAEAEYIKGNTDNPQQLNVAYKEARREREADHQKHLSKLADMEATHFKSNEDYAKARLKAEIEFRNEELLLAESNFQAVKNVTNEDTKETERAHKLLIESRKGYFSKRRKLLDDYGDKAKRTWSKIVAEEEKALSEGDKNYLQRVKIHKSTNDKIIAENDRYNDRVIKLNQRRTLALEAVENRLNLKLRDLAEERIDIQERADAQRRSNLSGAEDELRNLRSQFLSDSEQEAQDLIVADNKLLEGLRFIRIARKTGSDEDLKFGTDLINQAKSLYTALDNTNAAEAGLKRIAEAQNEVIDSTQQVELIEIQDKSEKLEAEAQRKKTIIERETLQRLKALEEEHKEALERLKDRHVVAVFNEAFRHTTKMNNVTTEHKTQVENLLKLRDLQGALTQDLATDINQELSRISEQDQAIRLDVELATVDTSSLDQEIENAQTEIDLLNYSLRNLPDLEEPQLKSRRTLDEKGIMEVDAGLQSFKRTTVETEYEIDKFNKSWNKHVEDMQKAIGSGAIDGVTNMFSSIISDSKDAGDALQDFARDFARMISDMLLKMSLYIAMGTTMKALGLGAFIPAFGFAEGGLVPGFANGGKVYGPGTGTSDSINAKLSKGEYVMTAEATKQYLPVLEAMRRGKFTDWLSGMGLSNMVPHIPRTPAYASGGLVSSMGVGNENNVEVNVNVANGQVSSSTQSTGTGPRLDELGRLIGNLVSSEIVKQQRPGGLLNG